MSAFRNFLFVPRIGEPISPPAADAPREDQIDRRVRASERLMPDLLNRIRNWRLLGTEKTRSEAFRYVVEDRGVPGEPFQVRYYPVLNVAHFAAPPAVEQSVRQDARLRALTIYDGKRFRVSDAPAASAPERAWHLAPLNLPPIEERREWSRDVAIGFVDTGIDPTHPEFRDRPVVFAEFDAAGDPVPAAEVRDARLPHGHGTGVAALAAGRDGVAPEAALVMALALPNLAGTPEQVIAAMNWLATVALPGGPNGSKKGVDLINTSMVLCDGLGNPLYSPSLRLVVATLRSLHIEVFAAIGNGGPAGATGSPGNYPEVHAFGAYDRNGRLWDGTSRGPTAEHPGVNKPDFLAPGVNVRAAQRGGGYHCMTGTSCASALGVGVAALMFGEARRRGRAPRYRSDWIATGRFRAPVGEEGLCCIQYVPLRA